MKPEQTDKKQKKTKGTYWSNNPFQELANLKGLPGSKKKNRRNKSKKKKAA